MFLLSSRLCIASGVSYGSKIGCRSRTLLLPPPSCFKVFSSTSTLRSAEKTTHHHRSLRRQKLHIGFASLSNAIPFEVPSNTINGKVGDKELDPRASIMLTALRGGVSNFDCPAPPLIEKNIQSSCKDENTCWMANRQSELNIGNAFDQAWDALLEEDDGEAQNVTAGEGSAVTIACRLGYRAAVVLSEEDANDAKDDIAINDCQEREGKFHRDTRVNVLFAGKAADEDDGTSSQPAVALVHNLSQEYVLHSLRTSPLVQKYKLNANNNSKKVSLISLAHNPETQIAAYLMNNHQIEKSKTQLLQKARIYMKDALKSAFIGYEIAVSEGLIDAYGVDSNGLSLQPNHDMHLSWRDILECATDAFVEVHGSANNKGRSSLKTIRLPCNILEIRGLDVANEICYFFGTCGSSNGEGNSSEEGLPTFTEDQSDHHVQQRQKLRKMRNILPSSVDVYVTRPLTAYPNGGTGWDQSSPGLSESSGRISVPPAFLNGNRGSSTESDGKTIDAKHPVRILDYQVESGPIGQPGELSWTNFHFNRHGPRPSAYQPILNAVLSHFDADAILEASRERELTVEERETLDGCKLLRDMIHDLDSSLDTMKSFAAYEEYLVNVAVPLIYGSFEELDEESAGMLQLFFRVHGMAVRMVVARWTREMLTTSRELDKDQEKKMAKVRQMLGFGELKSGYNIPDDTTLQEFALKKLLDESAVKGVVIGCSRPEHVLEAVRAADYSNSV
ncbi:hypothetical protein ACHAXM_000507 [Skeletonema potamos]